MGMRSIIMLEGNNVTIYRESEGALDDYGDATPTWAALDDQEKVWIQPVSTFRGRNSVVVASLAGRIDASTFVGFLKRDTTILKDDYLDDGTHKYEVVKVFDIEVFSTLMHKEAHLRLMEEGE